MEEFKFFTTNVNSNRAGNILTLKNTILEVIIDTAEWLKVIENICQRNNVQTLDISNIKFVLNVAEQMMLSTQLSRLALKPSCTDILVPTSLLTVLRGKVKGLIVKDLKQSIGEKITLSICSDPLQLTELIDPRKFIGKIKSLKMTSQMEETIHTLKNIESLPASPMLYAAVKKAYRCIRKMQRTNPSARECTEEELNEKEMEISTAAVPSNNTAAMSSTQTVDTSGNLKSNCASSVTDDFELPKTTQKTFICYVCKKRHSPPKRKIKCTVAHRQYPRLCLPCADFNYEKRNQKVDLKGKYAIVTGGRIKIGYELVLKMLRDGCYVIVTTRFPHNAIKTLSKEKDFQEWKDKVKVYPLDLKDVAGIYRFVEYVKDTVPHLDIIINNAAQTLRRPIDFYRQLLDDECIPQNHLQEQQQRLLATTEVLDYGYHKQNLTAESSCLHKPTVQDVTDQTADPGVKAVENNSNVKVIGNNSHCEVMDIVNNSTSEVIENNSTSEVNVIENYSNSMVIENNSTSEVNVIENYSNSMVIENNSKSEFEVITSNSLSDGTCLDQENCDATANVNNDNITKAANSDETKTLKSQLNDDEGTLDTQFGRSRLKHSLVDATDLKTTEIAVCSELNTNSQRNVLASSTSDIEIICNNDTNVSAKAIETHKQSDEGRLANIISLNEITPQLSIDDKIQQPNTSHKLPDEIPAKRRKVEISHSRPIGFERSVSVDTSLIAAANATGSLHQLLPGWEEVGPGRGVGSVLLSQQMWQSQNRRFSKARGRRGVNSAHVFSQQQYFPRGAVDADRQQLDLRRHNSWRAVIDTVPLPELMEVLMINAVAPFILNKELKPLLTKSAHKKRFIVNVSAMEGQFERKSKTKFHPHTNMAKAALNMMTRTAALGYATAGIYMTSVDTGWVSDERPLHIAKKEQKVKGFKLPLDCIDGAARIYDPVVRGYTHDETPLFAVFIKDYKVYPW